jgi:hypothetical protein
MSGLILGRTELKPDLYIGSIPNVPLIERNMILLKKRAHFVLKTPLAVVRLLLVDITNQCANIRRPNGKQSIPTLPCEPGNTLVLHPRRRSRLDLRNNFRRRPRRSQPHREMNMIGYATHTETFAIQLPRRPRQIRMQRRLDTLANQRRAILRAENNMNQIETQRLRHGTDFISRHNVSGLQPSSHSFAANLGLRPRLVCRRAFGPQSASSVGGTQ